MPNTWPLDSVGFYSTSHVNNDHNLKKNGKFQVIFVVLIVGTYFYDELMMILLQNLLNLLVFLRQKEFVTLLPSIIL